MFVFTQLAVLLCSWNYSDDMLASLNELKQGQEIFIIST